MPPPDVDARARRTHPDEPGWWRRAAVVAGQSALAAAVLAALILVPFLRHLSDAAWTWVLVLWVFLTAQAGAVQVLQWRALNSRP